MKVAAALIAGAGVATAFQASAFNGAAVSRSTREAAAGPVMVFGKKKAAASTPEPIAKATRNFKAALPSKQQASAAVNKAAAPVKQAASKAQQAGQQAASKAQRAAPAPLKKAPTQAKQAASQVKQAAKPAQQAFKKAASAPAPSGGTGVAAVAFGSDVEAPFWDPAKLSVDKPSETLDWYRAAELKHGRVAMLAVLGTWINAAGITLPDEVFQGSTKSFDALAKVADQRPGALIQIVLAIAAVEVLSIQLPEGAFPGDLGFDPANQIPVFERQGKFDDLRLKELKNGRLAMLGIMGMWVQEGLTGQGVFEQIASGHLSPVNDGQGYF